jgi:hypothetical protein
MKTAKRMTSTLLTLGMLLTLVSGMTLSAAAAVHTVGDYAALTAALGAAGDGDVIQLSANITGAVSYTVGPDVTVTIDGTNAGGENYALIGPDLSAISGAGSAGLALGGSGRIILRNLTLMGGLTPSDSGVSTGLYINAGDLDVQCQGRVCAVGSGDTFVGSSLGLLINALGDDGSVRVTEAVGGPSNYHSSGVDYYGGGTVYVGRAAGGQSNSDSCGVYMSGADGVLHVDTATGGTVTGNNANSFGICNGDTGTIYVGAASGGTVLSTGYGYSYGVYNGGAGVIHAATATGGAAPMGSNGYSYGAYNYGDNGGVVHVTTATGGFATCYSCGVYNEYGSLHAFTATGGTVSGSSFAQSYGAINGYGCLNVGTATGGGAHSSGTAANSYGILNSEGIVNAQTAIGGEAEGAAGGSSYGVFTYSGTVNVGAATASANANGIYGVFIESAHGTVNAGAADTVSSVGTANIGPQETASVTLVKVSSAACPLSAIVIAAAGDTDIGEPPAVYGADGAELGWYLDSERTMLFAGDQLNPEITALYSGYDDSEGGTDEEGGDDTGDKDEVDIWSAPVYIPQETIPLAQVPAPQAEQPAKLNPDTGARS